MIPHTDIAGLAGATLAITASLLLVPPIRRLKRIHLGLLMGAAAIVSAAPIGALPLAAYARGISGDLSVTTLVFLALAIYSHLAGRRSVDGKQKLAMNGLIVLTASIFYPMALGFGPFDPYRLGYGSTGFLAGLLMLALGAWAVRFHLISICISLSVLTHALGLYESTNLWDYLLDPLVSIYAVVAALICVQRTFARPGDQGTREPTAPPQDAVESTRPA